jgi:translation initiation factor IF-1
MGRMKELFLDQMQRNSIAADIPSEDDAIVFLAVVKNYDNGDIIKVGAFHSHDTAHTKGRDYVNRQKIDAADVVVYPMSWLEVNGHM